MKRFGAGLLAFCLFLMCGCSGESAPKDKNIMYIVDGAYNLTPQEYIDLMNQNLEAQEDGDYLTIPNWDEAVGSAISPTISFDIRFSVTEDGKITRISYHWKNTTEAANTAVFLVGATIGMISTENGKEIIEKLDMLNFSKKSYETTFEMDGSDFYYMSAEYGEHNWFSVEISDGATPAPESGT